MTTAQLDVSDPGAHRLAGRLKLSGLALLALPVTVFAVFAVAEGLGRAAGWWGHVIQLAVGVLLAAGAWFRPRIGGPLLVLVGMVLTVWILLLAGNRGSADVLSPLAIVSAPMMVASVLFTLAGITTTRATSHG